MTLPRDIPITTDLADRSNIQKFLGQGKRAFFMKKVHTYAITIYLNKVYIIVIASNAKQSLFKVVKIFQTGQSIEDLKILSNQSSFSYCQPLFAFHVV